MRNYRVEFKDLRDDMCINVDNVKADLFVVDDSNTHVTFYEERESIGGGMIPVAMYPFQYISSINTDPAEEGDIE